MSLIRAAPVARRGRGDLGFPGVDRDDEPVGYQDLQRRKQPVQLLIDRQFGILEVRGLGAKIDDRGSNLPVVAGQAQRVAGRLCHRMLIARLG